MNKVFLIGNLTADPQVSAFDSGHTACRFTIAVSRFTRSEDNRTDFINIVTWDGLAQNCAKYLLKGSKVAVVGSIQTGSYEKDGIKRQTVDIRAEQVEFLTRPNNGATANTGSSVKENVNTLQEVEDDLDDGMPF